MIIYDLCDEQDLKLFFINLSKDFIILIIIIKGLSSYFYLVSRVLAGSSHFRIIIWENLRAY